MILVAEQVSVTKRNKKIVRQVDLGVAAGEVLGLLGPNGAGKTTLLKAMGGLESISSGRVALTGKSLADYDREERARRLAYLGQSEASHWDMEVEAVVRLGRLPHRRKAPATNEDAVARAMAATAVASLAAGV